MNTPAFRVGDEPEIVATIVERGASGALSAVDISTATGLTFQFKMPDGDVITKTGIFKNTGTDGKLRYQADSAFFPLSRREEVVGQWAFEARAKIGTHWFTSVTGHFLVQDVLRAS